MKIYNFTALELIAMSQSASGKRDGRQGEFYFPPKRSLKEGF